MEPTLGLLSSSGGGGGGLSKETISEVSSYSNESELELGLGLSLGGGSGVKVKGTPWGEFSRILTAKDLPCGFLSGRATTTTAASAVAGGVSGTKRGADCVGPPDVESVNSTVVVSRQIVGWPPIGAYRMNSLVNQAKAPNAEEDKGVGVDEKGKDSSKEKVNHGSQNNEIGVREKGHSGFVKVNMDGLAIGRKVDLNAYSCYETLAQTLEEMFFKSSTSTGSILGDMEQEKRPSKLLDGSSEFVLTYEDKEGDWMLVGDVPWGMFVSTVKRLRIMKTSEANGLAPRFQEYNERKKGKPI